MLPTMSEIDTFTQAYDELSIECDAARDEYELLNQAEHLIVELAGGIVKVVNTFTADQYQTYEAFNARVSTAFARYVEANERRHEAFKAYYRVRYGVELETKEAEADPK